MRPMNYVAFDVHCAFCEGGWVTESGREKNSWRLATTIPALSEAIRSVPAPRLLVIEEGPLADWLVRELSGEADQVVVADPYRNALIAKEGDKDDPIDWRKLAHWPGAATSRPCTTAARWSGRCSSSTCSCTTGG
jgi:hypothetical protein